MYWRKHDTIALKEVVISDTQLRDFSTTQSVQTLNDSVISKNAASLTSLLNIILLFILKKTVWVWYHRHRLEEQQPQQTAVIWNGININSQLNGANRF